MALLNIFKKKKPKERAGEETSSLLRPFAKARVGEETSSLLHLRPPKAGSVAEEGIKEIRTEAVVPKKEKKTIVSETYRTLKIPHITEKATDLAEKNQYAFRIFSGTNKTEVKRAIEDTYGVDVVSVKIINVHKKKRRLGKIRGIKPGYKKAIVKIKKGQKIEMLSR